ncbi:A24 family peptidase [Listeria sp. PSOL-1]|uniref:prepilin peptidase n=1 Tax=Listeria sp. PSOL-1 TaxID=1844999 RepID=UPI0013D2D7EE|nr:A24 family peptidase [Listeria sp. PSOL-1]
MIIFLIFVYTSILYSFIQVAAQNFSIQQPFLFRFSHCDYCKKKLTVLEKIPIFSFLYQKGKTRCCQKKLAFIYLFGEVFTPSVVVFLYLKYQFSQPFWHLSIIFLVLTFFVISDLYYLFVPNSLLIGLFFYISIYRLSFELTWSSYLYLLMSSFSLFMLLFFLVKRNIGLGDIKLMIILTLGFGFKKGQYIFLTALIIALVAVTAALLMRKINKKTKIPFIPFIYIGYIIQIIYPYES